jgi:hypothetical protein
MVVAMTGAEIAVAIEAVVAVGDAAEDAIAAAVRKALRVAHAIYHHPSTLRRKAENREATKIAARNRAVTTTDVPKARGLRARRLPWKRLRSRFFFPANPWQSIAASPSQHLHLLLRRPLSTNPIMMNSRNRWRMRRARRPLFRQPVLAAVVTSRVASPAACLAGSWPRPARKRKEARRVKQRTQRKKFPRQAAPLSNPNPFAMKSN